MRQVRGAGRQVEANEEAGKVTKVGLEAGLRGGRTKDGTRGGSGGQKREAWRQDNGRGGIGGQEEELELEEEGLGD